jgi:hypothetical protein
MSVGFSRMAGPDDMTGLGEDGPSFPVEETGLEGGTVMQIAQLGETSSSEKLRSPGALGNPGR